jgi:hypothetical protein
VGARHPSGGGGRRVVPRDTCGGRGGANSAVNVRASALSGAIKAEGTALAPSEGAHATWGAPLPILWPGATPRRRRRKP